ncbi:NAD-dependent epimerase/dehydratase family protein [Brachybacterium sp. MASK1Z-5]|uniref:NAD-dependent epimerase/dehydratase family protein n=1 Tax=Brachybacterium halotolerans TaxID=2795215 RepID=A0ABS1B7V5_9MICO|nr:NAD-dependent epimerase/dehydratase family protein [Brachybacterium halotolerans]MBK0330711.1 NAD-dependent epimerase/dehydratase family protein [Brachybacterium halotolerans]
MSASSSVIDTDLAEIIGRDLPWDALSGSTVLVTGASGMLPSYAVRTLLRLNDERGTGVTVHGLVRNGDKARRALADVLDREDFRLIVQDVAEPLDIEGRLDLIIHGASAARPSLHSSDPIGTMRANLLGTMNLLDLAVRKGSTFSLMSSAEVYGAQDAELELIPEDSYGGFDILNPRACYSEGKRAAETLCAAYSAQYGITSRIARFGHIYGPGMALDDGRVQAEFTAKVLAGEDIVLNSDGSSQRTYTYVADAIAGLFVILLKGDETVYNISDVDGLVSIRGLAEAFTTVRPELGLQVHTKPSDTGGRYAPVKAQGLDSGRLLSLGWRPLVDLRHGLARTVDSHRDEV